jgi:hypothetical protein
MERLREVWQITGAKPLPPNYKWASKLTHNAALIGNALMAMGPSVV